MRNSQSENDFHFQFSTLFRVIIIWIETNNEVSEFIAKHSA